MVVQNQWGKAATNALNASQGMQQLLDLLWTVKGSISECAALLGLREFWPFHLPLAEFQVFDDVCLLMMFQSLFSYTSPLYCRLSTGVLSRLIVSDKKLWNAVNSLRATHVCCSSDFGILLMVEMESKFKWLSGSITPGWNRWETNE
jgi:hypothetical protein